MCLSGLPMRRGKPIAHHGQRMENAASFRDRLGARWRETGSFTRAIFIGIPVLAILFAVAWTQCFFTGCPDVHRLQSYQPGGASILVDRNG